MRFGDRASCIENTPQAVVKKTAEELEAQVESLERSLAEWKEKAQLLERQQRQQQLGMHSTPSLQQQQQQQEESTTAPAEAAVETSLRSDQISSSFGLAPLPPFCMQ